MKRPVDLTFFGEGRMTIHQGAILAITNYIDAIEAHIRLIVNVMEESRHYIGDCEYQLMVIDRLLLSDQIHREADTNECPDILTAALRTLNQLETINSRLYALFTQAGAFGIPSSALLMDCDGAGIDAKVFGRPIPELESHVTSMYGRILKVAMMPCGKGHHGSHIFGHAIHTEGVYQVAMAGHTTRMSILNNKDVDMLLVGTMALIHDVMKTAEYSMYVENDENGYPVLEINRMKTCLDHGFLLAAFLTGNCFSWVSEEGFLSSDVDLKEFSAEVIQKMTLCALTHHGKWAHFQSGDKHEINEAVILHNADMIESRSSNSKKKSLEGAFYVLKPLPEEVANEVPSVR